MKTSKKWRFVFADTREVVAWVNDPQRPFGPFASKALALQALYDELLTSEPSDVGYVLVEDDRQKAS